MKLIIAYIRPEKLADVKQKLVDAEVFKVSVTNALGHGDQQTYREKYRGADVEIDLMKRVRLEIAVNESFVERTVQAIIAGAQTGQVGDGKVFVVPLEQCYRIRTGEQGGPAIG
jgi:nitrogen regulatory protein P-II 1